MNKTLASIIAIIPLTSVACETIQEKRIAEVCARGNFDNCPSGQIMWGDENGKYCISEQRFRPEELKEIIDERKVAYLQFKQEYCD